jgi:ribosome production factor 2
MAKTSNKYMKSKKLTKNKRPKMIAATPGKMKRAAGKKERHAIKAGIITSGEDEGKAAKPKRRKARIERLMKSREPQLVEHTKSVLVLKGHKVSEIVRGVLLDIAELTKPNNNHFSRKNEILPFEDINSLEFLCEKNQCSLFCLGSHTKKRPDNIVLGRLFDGHLLDMYEFGVSNFQALTDFQGQKKKFGSKPIMIFNGDQWQSDAVYKRVGNLLLDLFRADRPDKLSLRGLDHVISCSIADGKIHIRGYNLRFLKSGTKVPDVQLGEMGPFLDLTMRRQQLASEDMWKAATKKAAPTEKKQKNVNKTVLGDKIGRVHMKKQQLDKMGGKRAPALRDGKRPLTDVDESFGTAVRNTKMVRRGGGD